MKFYHLILLAIFFFDGFHNQLAISQIDSNFTYTYTVQEFSDEVEQILLKLELAKESTVLEELAIKKSRNSDFVTNIKVDPRRPTFIIEDKEISKFNNHNFNSYVPLIETVEKLYSLYEKIKTQVKFSNTKERKDFLAAQLKTFIGINQVNEKSNEENLSNPEKKLKKILQTKNIFFSKSIVTQYFDQINFALISYNPKLGIKFNNPQCYAELNNYGMDLNTIKKNIFTLNPVYPDVSVFDPATPSLPIGAGLFANSTLPVGTNIGIYTGEVGQLGDERDYFLRSGNIVIDGKYVGNHTRFINCAIEKEDANIGLFNINYFGLSFPVFIVIKEVQAGQELLFQYGYKSYLDTVFSRITPDSRKIDPNLLKN